MTMIPGLFKQNLVDGVYWTLQYELRFYFFVFMALFLGLRSHLEKMIVAWPIAMLVAASLKIPNGPLWGDHYCFFAAGSLFTMMRNRVSPLIGCAFAASLYLCLTTTARLAAEAALDKGTEFSLFVISSIILGQFAFFFLLNSEFGMSLRLPGSRLAGNLTYPICLIHAHFGYMVLSRFGNDSNRWIAYSTTLALVFSIAYVIHSVVEKRCEKWWFGLFDKVIGTPVVAINGWLRFRF